MRRSISAVRRVILVAGAVGKVTDRRVLRECAGLADVGAVIRHGSVVVVEVVGLPGVRFR